MRALVPEADGLAKTMASAILNWARAPYRGLLLVDPVDAVIKEIRAGTVTEGP